MHLISESKGHEEDSIRQAGGKEEKNRVKAVDEGKFKLLDFERKGDPIITEYLMIGESIE